ncbi:MAG: bromoperoxidase [Pseudomonadota bacterium]
MALNPTPKPNGTTRAKEAESRRLAQQLISAKNGPAKQKSNGEETKYVSSQLTSFTKGLPHNDFGVAKRKDYETLVSALNNPDLTFKVPTGFKKDNRKWESPLAGHFYDTQGPDADAVAMAPAPKLGSSELCAEMALVYLMAVLRDLPLNRLHDPKQPTGYLDNSGTPITMKDILNECAKLSWLDPAGNPVYANGKKGDANATPVELARRRSLWEEVGKGGHKLTLRSLFRGSTKGAKQGDYLSQFMLIGTQNGRHMNVPENGIISFGTNTINQRVAVTMPGQDYMQNWSDWLDVQKGLDTGGKDAWLPQQKFLTTLRDLGDYVHVDALYQAYFNACLILIDNKNVKLNAGFPTAAGNPTRSATTTGFAQFGGPHILSLMTEIATRGLKAVRRQKFQIHRRARPEVIAARLTAHANGFSGASGFEQDAQKQLQSMLDELSKTAILDLVASRNSKKHPKSQIVANKYQIDPDKNYLLPMAFPEGSPMHAAYGAGHATVAGACVTMLKAFFDDAQSLKDIIGANGYEPDPSNGLMLQPGAPLSKVSIGDELDKLAANVSIGRNMAGVRYHSDYFDSLRLGERVAVGTLVEHMLDYPEKLHIELTSFDGDAIRIDTSGGKKHTDVKVIIQQNGTKVSYADWWWRHV